MRTYKNVMAIASCRAHDVARALLVIPNRVSLAGGDSSVVRSRLLLVQERAHDGSCGCHIPLEVFRAMPSSGERDGGGRRRAAGGKQSVQRACRCARAGMRNAQVCRQNVQDSTDKSENTGSGNGQSTL